MNFFDLFRKSLERTPDRVAIDDGTEAMDPEDRQYGAGRPLSFSDSLGEEGARASLTKLRDDVRAFAGEAEQHDDITVLMFIRKEDA